MISKLSRDELVALGARHRANYVIAQGRYTLGTAAEDPELRALLGSEFVAEVDSTLRRLETAITDRDIAGAESRDSALAQGEAVQAGKVWRRAMTSRALAAILRGVEIPGDLGRATTYGRNPTALARDIQRLVGMAQPNQAALAPLGVTPEFIEKGSALARTLLSADETQEKARLNKLPEKVRQMYEQKALVYLAVKQINHLGRSVYAEDSGAASRYNLDILYRRVRRQPVDPATAATAVV